MQVYSHSYWLVIFCTTNRSRVLARDSWQTFENSWKKSQFLMNTLYMINLQAREDLLELKLRELRLQQQRLGTIISTSAPIGVFGTVTSRHFRIMPESTNQPTDILTDRHTDRWTLGWFIGKLHISISPSTPIGA